MESLVIDLVALVAAMEYQVPLVEVLLLQETCTHTQTHSSRHLYRKRLCNVFLNIWRQV